jgi:hypothetical protein
MVQEINFEDRQTGPSIRPAEPRKSMGCEATAIVPPLKGARNQARILPEQP